MRSTVSYFKGAVLVFIYSLTFCKYIQNVLNVFVIILFILPSYLNFSLVSQQFSVCFLLRFILSFINLSVYMFAYIYVCTPHACLAEARWWYSIKYNWIYRGLWAAMWAVWVSIWSSATIASNLKSCALSLSNFQNFLYFVFFPFSLSSFSLPSWLSRIRVAIIGFVDTHL